MTRCNTPECQRRANPDAGLWGVFCTRCADNLARIRDELDAETAARCPSLGSGGRKDYRPPVCCTPGCDEPRKSGQSYCAVCRAMGAIEDEAA